MGNREEGEQRRARGMGKTTPGGWEKKDAKVWNKTKEGEKGGGDWCSDSFELMTAREEGEGEAAEKGIMLTDAKKGGGSKERQFSYPSRPSGKGRDEGSMHACG